MWLLLLQVFCSCLSLATLLVLLWVAREYIRGKRQIHNLLCKFWESLRPLYNRMQMDDMIDELLAEETPAGTSKPEAKHPETNNPVVEEQRERLASIVAGGQARKYLGKFLTVEEIESLPGNEVSKLYALYEAQLGSVLTKTLGKLVIELYASTVSLFLPITPDDRHLLMKDLESDPFVNNALNSYACAMYYRFGMFLAPFTAALITVKHCQFGHQCPITDIYDGEQPGDNSNREQPSGSGGCCGGQPSSPGDCCGETSA